MIRSPALLCLRAVFAVGVVLGQVTLCAQLREATAAEDNTLQSALLNAYYHDWSGADTEGARERVASKALRQEGYGEEQPFENGWAQYLSPQDDEIASTAEVEQ